MRTNFFTLILSAALLGCSPSKPKTPVITTPTVAQIAEFTRNASITLPASARPVGWREERGMDDALWLQVKLPASDLPSFLEASPFRGVELADHDEYSLHQFEPFFSAPPTRYRAASLTLAGARVLKMVIDESVATDAVVYLMWHET